LEAWQAGMEAANGIAMMFCVHGGEEVRCGFVFWCFLLGPPMHEAAVSEPAEHPHDAHGFGQAHPAMVIEVADVQPNERERVSPDTRFAPEPDGLLPSAAWGS